MFLWRKDGNYVKKNAIVAIFHVQNYLGMLKNMIVNLTINAMKNAKYVKLQSAKIKNVNWFVKFPQDMVTYMIFLKILCIHVLILIIVKKMHNVNLKI